MQFGTSERRKISDFWQKYRQKVIASGVPERFAEWYVRWAQKFAVSMKGKPLRQRTWKDVEEFLRSMKGQKGVEPWQVDQAKAALELLYSEFLKLDLKGQGEAHRDENYAEEPDINGGTDLFLDHVKSKDELEEKGFTYSWQALCTEQGSG